MKGILAAILFSLAHIAWCQKTQVPSTMHPNLYADTSGAKTIYSIGNFKANDTVPTVNFPPVNIITFKTDAEWMEYYRTRARLMKVLPYVKIAKELYVELKENEDTSSKKEFRHYRKETEKQMRNRFEKELKDLTVSEGKILFKLINRETGNNCYTTIKGLKGPFMAWFYQTVAKRWGYDLKEDYNPANEKMSELIIKQMGPTYKI